MLLFLVNFVASTENTTEENFFKSEKNKLITSGSSIAIVFAISAIDCARMC